MLAERSMIDHVLGGYLASPIVINKPCHSSSKGCTPMAGYSL